MIAARTRTPDNSEEIELLRRIAAALESGNVVTNCLSVTGSATGKMTDNVNLTAMTPIEVAKWWLVQNPDGRNTSDRELERTIQPAGKKISRETWRKAKKG